MLLDGRYETGVLLGRGGMADVWDGWDHVGGHPVAVKVLHPQFADRADIRRRFYAEAVAAAAIGHQNVVDVYAHGDEAGTPFIVMERLSGGTLADEIERGPIPQDRVRSILDGVLGALAATHAQGVLHRDIKPGNLLIAGDGYKLADFGLAKTDFATHTAVGEVFGTFAYLSPQRLGGAPSSVDDDLYAVGVIGYEALAGRHPYGPTEDLAAVTTSILRGDATPLSFLAPDADPILIATIERAMAHDPRARFASAAEMRAALAGHAVRPAPAVCARPTVRPATKVYSRPPLADPAPSVVVSTPAQGRGSDWAKVAAVIAVLAAVVAIGFAFARTSDTSIPSPKPISTVEPIAPAPSSPEISVPKGIADQEPPKEQDSFVGPPKEKGPKGEGPRGNGNGNGNGNGPKEPKP